MACGPADHLRPLHVQCRAWRAELPVLRASSFVNTNPGRARCRRTRCLAGRYTIGKCLGLDGEGITYSAIDGKEMRRVTIKEYVPVSICAARAADGRVLPRAGREVLFKTTRMDFADLYRSLVRLGRTEGLVTVLDVVETNDTAYAVREPDEGAPLSRYLASREEPLTQEEALVLLRPVVYGVDAMHRMGLLHRGISPDTIWITPQGAKLSGFATQGLRTAGGEIKCQLADGYAAPEQYSVAEFDGKYTDVYSLAAVFYRVMTGVEPLGANLRRMDDNMPSARTANRELPGFVSAALARAMRLVPAERIQSASELLAALTAPSREVTGSKWDQLREKLGMTDRQLKILGIAAAAGAAGDYHLHHRHPEHEPAPQPGLFLQLGHNVLGAGKLFFRRIAGLHAAQLYRQAGAGRHQQQRISEILHVQHGI